MPSRRYGFETYGRGGWIERHLDDCVCGSGATDAGHLTSIEIEPERQEASRVTLSALGLSPYVTYICADAGDVLPRLGEVDLAFLDCEKVDYVRFFDLLVVCPGGLARISHELD
jgi:caffeoyl-CoA O-methyltransferase